MKTTFQNSVKDLNFQLVTTKTLINQLLCKASVQCDHVGDYQRNTYTTASFPCGSSWLQ